MKVCCVSTLESPHWGDSKEYTLYLFQYKEENHTKLFQICSQWIFSKELKKEFETAVVNEQSVIEPLKFYCKLDTFPSFVFIQILLSHTRHLKVKFHVDISRVDLFNYIFDLGKTCKPIPSKDFTAILWKSRDCVIHWQHIISVCVVFMHLYH